MTAGKIFGISEEECGLIALSVANHLSGDIAALEELGVWTDEDDQAVDPSLSDL